MKPEFSTCLTGTRQSPIDIRDGIRVDLDPVQFDYKPSGFRVIDTGHTVQVNVAAGNAIEVMGGATSCSSSTFTAVGRAHRRQAVRHGRAPGPQDIEGRLAVVAVLLESGSAQPIVQSVWNNLPLEKGEEVAARSLLN